MLALVVCEELGGSQSRNVCAGSSNRHVSRLREQHVKARIVVGAEKLKRA